MFIRINYICIRLSSSESPDCEPDGLDFGERHRYESLVVFGVSVATREGPHSGTLRILDSRSESTVNRVPS